MKNGKKVAIIRTKRNSRNSALVEIAFAIGLLKKGEETSIKKFFHTTRA